MRTIGYLLVLASALGACSSDSSSPASLNGTIHGKSFAMKDAASGEVVVTTAGGAMLHTGAILLTSTAGTCADVDANQAHQNEKGLLLVLWDVVGTTTNAPTQPGMYSVYQGSGTSPMKAGTVNALSFDATCNPIAADAAKGATGTVNLTAVSGMKYSGTFDVSLDSGDHITGSFDPIECPSLGNYLAPTNNAACI
jgi:hypothetical protein